MATLTIKLPNSPAVSHVLNDAIIVIGRGMDTSIQVEDETLSRTSMDDARARIRRLKEKYLLPYRDPDPRAARAAAGAGERAALSRDIMDRAGMTA